MLLKIVLEAVADLVEGLHAEQIVKVVCRNAVVGGTVLKALAADSLGLKRSAFRGK